jgi:hypothetical protein
VTLAVDPVLAGFLRSLGQSVSAPISALAPIDTGASRTVVRDDLIQRLGLQPTGSAFVATPSSAPAPYPEYIVRLEIPSATAFDIRVIAIPLHDPAVQCLIGRDILRQFVLVYNGPAGSCSLAILPVARGGALLFLSLFGAQTPQNPVKLSVYFGRHVYNNRLKRGAGPPAAGRGREGARWRSRHLASRSWKCCASLLPALRRRRAT